MPTKMLAKMLTIMFVNSKPWALSSGFSMPARSKVVT